MRERTPRVFITPTIVVINVLVFLAMVASGVSETEPTAEDLIAWGADWGPATALGEWWRTLTSAFVHIGAIHLLLNMWCLWRIGHLTERLYGNGAFAFLYLASAVLASLASLYWKCDVVSAGASGAVFGVCGALLAYLKYHPREVPAARLIPLRASTLAFVGYNLFAGFLFAGTDNAAHIGGLVTGFVFGWYTVRPDGRRFATFAGGSLALFVLTWIHTRSDPTILEHDALQKYEDNDYLAAIAAYSKAIRIGGDLPRLHFHRGLAQQNLRLHQNAIDDMSKAIRLSPGRAEYYFSRAEAYLAIDEHSKGLADLDRAIELDPNRSATPHSMRADLRWSEGLHEPALADLDNAVAVAPEDVWCRADRAHARYALGRWQGALRDFEYIDRIDGDGRLSHADLFIWLVRSRLGERASATEDLRRSIADASPHHTAAATRELACFLSGSVPEGDILAASNEKQNDLESAGAAWFFAGSKRLIDGDRAKAIRHLEMCASLGDYNRFALATAELKRLR